MVRRRAKLLLGVVVVALIGVSPSPSSAAFPGRNGVLAAQPVSGGGVLLVRADGGGRRRICAAGSYCGHPRRPRWSPDGRSLVFAGPGIRIVYPDGSCLDCQFGDAQNPVFTPAGNEVSFLQGGRLTTDGIDGVRKPSAAVAWVSDAVWAADGKLAVVRRGAVWAGAPGRLKRLGAAAQPSWAPDAKAVAAVRGGWVVIMRLAGGHVRRLARGSAPAFSPDGRWVAFIDDRQRLMIISTTRPHSRSSWVGHVKARAVDWQPNPARTLRACVPPPGARVLASSAVALVTGDGDLQPLGFYFSPPLAYMGCLRASGRWRLLEKFTGNNVDAANYVRAVTLAAPYAALVVDFVDEHYMQQHSTVRVFDLRSGADTGLGGEEWQGMDPSQVVLGVDGVSAAHYLLTQGVGTLAVPLEQLACAPAGAPCLAVDGSFNLFTTTNPTGGAAAWRAAHFNFPLDAVACPSATLCVTAFVSTVFTSADPTAGAAAWQRAELPSSVNLHGFSCPSTSVCVGWGLNGRIAVSTNPTGGPQAWSTADVDGTNDLTDMSCPDTSHCVGTDFAGNVITSSNPTGGAAAWTVHTGGSRVGRVACPTPSLCVGIDPTASGLLTTTDPSSSHWSFTATASHIEDVACPSSSLCVAVGDGGTIYSSTSPATADWSQATVDRGRNLVSITCPSITLCLAGDRNGHIVNSTAPAGGPSAWSAALIDGDPCTDTTPCATEQIQSADATGVHTVDSSKLPGTGPFLTGLTLTGDVLSWQHAGTPQKATLTP